MRALIKQGHQVTSCECEQNWSTQNMVQDHGTMPVLRFSRLFPEIQISMYKDHSDMSTEVDRLTRGAQLVIVHEFNEPELINAAAEVRRERNDFVLLFHDTHHKAVSQLSLIESLPLNAYDGILAFGKSLSLLDEKYFSRPVWVLHEAADISLFYPRVRDKAYDLCWIGNWGDEERSEEIRTFLIQSARSLKDLKFVLYGVRYPEEAIRDLQEAGIQFREWVPKFGVPEVLARAKMTMHLPRRYYRENLAGIPTIRPFEALACSTPLISAPWEDSEELFRTGVDYLQADNPLTMQAAIEMLHENADARSQISQKGLQTIRARHTCDHRSRELIDIYKQLN